MGTNYYLRTDPCAACGRATSELHIVATATAQERGI